MPKIYKSREIIPAGHTAHTDLAHLSELVKHILYHRGIRTTEEAEKFLNPDWTRDIHDPFLMKDMDKAVGRIVKAIDNGEKIVVYS
ncbi:MAG: single-stranded-DNA-specific exonuclease RecJ, partial [Candidatus Paceibacterota bacterium]